MNSNTKKDFQTLLNHAADAAVYLLTKNKEFYPFAITLDNEDGVEIHDGNIEQDKPLSQDVIDALVIQVGRMKNIRAAAIATMGLDVEANSQDVIRIDFDHLNGDTMQVVIPYYFKGIKKQLRTGEPIFAAGDKRIVRAFEQ